jgi:serine protease
MGFPDRSPKARTRLHMEALEDRTTPAKLDETLTLALPELVATGAVAGDRVNVVMTSTSNSAADAAALDAAPFAETVTSLGFGIYSVTLTPGTDLSAALSFYASFAGVESVAPDTIIQVQRTPNDPSYSQLYGMAKIGAPTVWDTTTGNPNFVVAVIDTGVDYNHPDLAANMWRNPGETADGIDNDGNGFIDDIFGADFANNDGNPFDDNSHGTHVAGTIGAVGNNGVGVAGVNWSVKIMALKFLTASGSGATSNAVRALDYAVAKGVKVSNNSWGGGGASSTLAAAIDRARAAGHIFVAAAGNAGQNNNTTANYPSNYGLTYDNVVSVAATDQNDNLASFSNYGATAVTLAAPGVGIRSTTPNNTYSTFNGTSMATPHVAGAIALYWGANPNLTYQQVISKLKSSVDLVPSLSGKVATGGRLNVAKMFATVSPPTVVPGPKVISSTFGGTSTQLNKVTVTFDRAVNPTTFTKADVVSFIRPNGTSALGTISTVAPVSGTNNTQFVITFTGQTAAGTYSLTFGPDVRDTSGNQMNQNGNGVNGETADRYTATGALILNVSKTYSASPSLAIRDFATTASTITIADDVKISDLNARISLTHTYDSDLVITLTSPTGKTITLFNRRGGSGDNLTNTTFDDEAVTPIANGAAPFNGTYKPDVVGGVAQALSGYDGLSTKGAWTLRVTDNAAQDVGRLTSWSLIVAGTQGASGASAQSFGFRDESADFDLDTAIEEAGSGPIAVGASDVFDESSDPAVVEDAAPTPTASPLFYLLGSDPERTEDEATPPVESLDFIERENRPALSDDFETPLAVAYATLYAAPETSDEGGGEEEIFEAFAVD